MGDGKAYESLLPFSQFSFSKYGTVVIKKLLGELGSFFADFFEFRKV